MTDDVTLYLGDCLDVLRDLPDGSVDAVVTDPPYNAGLKYATYEDDLPPEVYWAWLRDVVVECNRVARNLVMVKHSAFKIADWCAHMGKSRMVVWYKPFSSGFRVNGFATHFEPIWVTQGKTVRWSKDVLVQNAGACNKEASTGHPAQMPEALARQIIEVAVDEGATVLDPFMGSGTTGVACVQTGRRFIGVEIDPTYYAIAERRIAEARAQLPLPLPLAEGAG
ncbi:MAG: hypothetical protein GX625_21355 [Clostridiaceae bacterium]|nr:hypothetical protein [Clostridiaceae bacterium]